jgi:hypothetical protein
MTYVFDIDGTLALCDHRLHFIKTKPVNWNAFFAGIHQDVPNKPMLSVFLHLLKIPETQLILATGRNEDCRVETSQWFSKHALENKTLDHHNIPLYMRKSKDYRPDDIVKVELLYDIIENHGTPTVWFDDRPRVIKAIREQGVFVVDVNQTGEDF